MIFAHLPAGYIASKLLYDKFEKHKVSYQSFSYWGMIGSIAPDFDLFYYYTIDQSRHYHHEYVTHLPVFWLSLLVISITWLILESNQKQNPTLAVIFTLNGFIHLILDTITGKIFWLTPFISPDKSFTLKPYLLLNQYTLELLVFVAAICLWKKNVILENIARLNKIIFKPQI